MKTTGESHITSHARKWHKTSPCPYCDAPKPIIEHYARIIGTTQHYFWLARCRKCPNAVLLKTTDDDIKNATRIWNRYANGEWRKRWEETEMKRKTRMALAGGMSCDWDHASGADREPR